MREWSVFRMGSGSATLPEVRGDSPEAAAPLQRGAATLRRDAAAPPKRPPNHTPRCSKTRLSVLGGLRPRELEML